LDSLKAYISEQERISIAQTISRVGYVAPDPQSSVRHVPVSHLSPLQIISENTPFIPNLFNKPNSVGGYQAGASESYVKSQNFEGKIYNNGLNEQELAMHQKLSQLNSDAKMNNQVSIYSQVFSNPDFKSPLKKSHSSVSTFLINSSVGVAAFVLMFSVGALVVLPKNTVAQIPLVQSLLSMATSSTVIFQQ
jgi:hypothetical protein